MGKGWEEGESAIARRYFFAFAPFLFAAAFLLLSFPAHAHKPSDSYLAIDVKGAELAVQWDIALRDLDYALGLDLDGDGALTWGEVKNKHADIAAYALSRLVVEAGGTACLPGEVTHLIDHHSDGAYAVLKFAVLCPDEAGALDLRYRLFFDLDPQHRGLLRLSHGSATASAIFSPQQQHFSLAERSRWQQFVDYCREGIWHIWIGFDHVLFLLALLLPAVLMKRDGRWTGGARFGAAFWEVFKIVTAFTLAHSITLSLAALEVVTLPSRWVESAIAASVLAAALNNVFPIVHERRWLVAFAFGLIHGFGFASVLNDLGLPQDSLLLSLFAFNAGVEIGQLAIVGVFLPLAFLARDSAIYQRGIVAGGSLLVATVAFKWLIERLFEL